MSWSKDRSNPDFNIKVRSIETNRFPRSRVLRKSWIGAQAREIARIRSTLGHARDEKYKTREVLVRLYDGRQAVLKLIEEEGKIYRRLCQQTQQRDLEACSLSIANGFRDEIAGVLDKQGKREVPA